MNNLILLNIQKILENEQSGQPILKFTDMIPENMRYNGVHSKSDSVVNSRYNPY